MLYPLKDKTSKELRQSVSDFCIQNNIIPADVISPSSEYDYFCYEEASSNPHTLCKTYKAYNQQRHNGVLYLKIPKKEKGITKSIGIKS